MRAERTGKEAPRIWGRFENKLSDVECMFYLNAIHGFTGQKRREGGTPCIFPGPSPVSTDAVGIATRDMSPYYASLKADGERSLLFLTKDVDGVPIAVLMNRQHEMVEVSVEVDCGLFAGTILDGELVIPVTRPHATCFLAFDTPVYSGNDVRRRPLRERYALLLTTTVSFGGEMSFQVKEYATMPNLPGLWSSRLAQAYSSDGVIFTHGGSPYIHGTDVTLLKWKQTHTVDIEAHGSGGVMVGIGTPMWLHREKVKVDGTSYACTLLIPEDIRGSLQEQGKLILECTCELLPSRKALILVAIKERADKIKPNGLRTFISTLAHVRSASSFDDICSALGISQSNATGIERGGTQNRRGRKRHRGTARRGNPSSHGGCKPRGNAQ